MKYASYLSCFVFLLSASAFGQSGGGLTAVTVSGSGRSFSTTANISMPPFLAPAVVGAPYSAEEVQQHTQTLSDGTHITNSLGPGRKMYRDSLGRTREERSLMFAPRGNPPGAPESPLLIQIVDPVAGVQYTLDTTNKIAHRIVVQAEPGGNLPTARQSQLGTLSAGPIPSRLPAPPEHAVNTAVAVARQRGARPQTAEKLGTEIIEGVLAEGERHTTTIPADEEGNDHPFKITSETWTSPELKLMVLNKNSDPRSGETILKMSNISRAEPDGSLFQVPPDYSIVDETGPFSINYRN